MPSAEAVARYLLHYAALSEEFSPVTQMQLHKLLYYAQAWSLASRHKPLFDGHIQAWTHGPVVAEIYPLFKEFKDRPIPATLGSDGANLTADERGQIETTWLDYGRYAAWQLREMTHKEIPWRAARAGLSDDARSDAPITSEALLAHFGPLYEEECRKAGIPIDLLRTPIDESTLVPWEVVKAELLAQSAPPSPTTTSPRS